jgi:hypothetical protein
MRSRCGPLEATAPAAARRKPQLNDKGIAMRQAFKTGILRFALALGLMAISATVAQAETGAYWEVGGTKIEGASELLPKFNVKKDTAHIILSFTLVSQKIELDCTAIKYVNGLLHKSGKTTGKLHLENCITKLNGAEAPCKPHSPGAELGLIETNALLGLLKLHTEGVVKEDLLELQPQEGETLLTFVLGVEGKEECLFLLGKNPIKGKIFLKDCQKELLINKAEHLFEEQRTLSKMFLATSPVTMGGSFLAFLVGKPHEGLLWSGHPG